jgi:iron complex outermembrane recepter protein
MASLRFDYSRPFADDLRGFVRVDYDWTGPSNGAFSPTNPDYSRPVYSVLNASVGVNLHGYEISVFAKNLLDDRKIIQRPALLSEPEAYTLRPFTMGLNVKTRF